MLFKVIKNKSNLINLTVKINFMVKKYFAKNKTLNFFLFFISIYGSCFSQDSLNFNRIKDIGIYVTENINTKYPEVDFLK